MAWFSVDVFHRIVDAVPGGSLAKVLERLDSIMETNAELKAGLEALTATSERDRAEVLAKIAELQAAIDAADTVDPGVLAAFVGLKAVIDARDADVEPPAPV
jgi:hypothetical protein